MAMAWGVGGWSAGVAGEVTLLVACKWQVRTNNGRCGVEVAVAWAVVVLRSCWVFQEGRWGEAESLAEWLSVLRLGMESLVP